MTKLGYKELRPNIKPPEIISHQTVFFFNPKDNQPLKIKSNEIVRLETGVSIKMDPKMVGITKESQNLKDKNLVQPHFWGVIDADYQHELLCQVENISNKIAIIKPGEKLNTIELQTYSSKTVFETIFESPKRVDKQTIFAAGIDLTLESGLILGQGLNKIFTELVLTKKIKENLEKQDQQTVTMLKNSYIGPRSSTPAKNPHLKNLKFIAIYDLIKNYSKNSNHIFYPVKSTQNHEYKEEARFLQFYSYFEINQIQELYKFNRYEETYTNSNRKGGFGSTG